MFYVERKISKKKKNRRRDGLKQLKIIWNRLFVCKGCERSWHGKEEGKEENLEPNCVIIYVIYFVYNSLLGRYR